MPAGADENLRAAGTQLHAGELKDCEGGKSKNRVTEPLALHTPTGSGPITHNPPKIKTKMAVDLFKELVVDACGNKWELPDWTVSGDIRSESAVLNSNTEVETLHRT